MKNLKAFVLIAILNLVSSTLFAQIKVISPAEGKWANKQMLVIDNSSSGDYFYSIDGSDPQSFGFAYDGPVLLDVTGDVVLKITHVKDDYSEENAAVRFSVVPDEALICDYSSFIASFYDTGIINYSAGTALTIPSDLYCSIGEGSENFFPGTTLTLSKNCVLNRYVPVTLLDKNRSSKWRFIVHTFPQSAGIFSRRDLPFTVENWTKINFVNQDLIYKVDDEYWSLPKEPLELDRTKSHMISWQSLAYEQGNPVEFFILPPKPELKEKLSDDGSVLFYLEGDEGYTISIPSSNDSGYTELFKEIGADCFYGDKTAGTLKLGIFASSVYQGEIEAEYNINKRPPALPQITSNTDAFYSRRRVDVEVTCDSGKDCDLFIAVSKPFVISDPSSTLNPDNQLFEQVDCSDFIKIDGNYAKYSFYSEGEGAAYYKLRAYSSNGTKQSLVSEYSVIVDQYNYYYNSSASPENADGTALHPFSDFAQCLEAMNESRTVCLNVSGTLQIPSGVNELTANAEIKTEADGQIIFMPGAEISVINSTLDITNCRISNIKQAKIYNTVPLFKLENSVLTMNNCIISTEFSKNANVIDAYNSVLNLSDSFVTVLSTSYASCITSVNSKINVKKSSLTAAADTGIIISSHNSELSIKDNICKVSGKKGRIAELFGGKADFANNKFNAELTSNAASLNPLYTNSKTQLKLSDNESNGF